MAGNAFGPLVEPGWPSSLPKSPDLGGAFLSAFQIGSQVNARQRALENQLAGMALKQQAMEYDHELDRAKFGLAQEKLAMQADRNADLLAISQANLGLRQETANLAVTKYNDLLEGKSGLVEAQATLEQEGLHPGDKDYIRRFNELTSPIIGKVPTSTLNAVQRTIYNNHNSAAKEKQKYYDSEWKHFTNEASGILYGNQNPVNPDLTPIIHPEMLEPEVTGGGLWGLMGPEKKTGKYVVPGVEDRTVNMADITRLKQRYDDLMKLRADLAPQVDRPDIGVNSGVAMPSSKAQLVPNTIYSTPKGNLRWNGTAFVTP